MFTLLRNAYYLSVPVVLGAVLSNRLAARLSDVEPVHWATPVVLALVVFMIYTADRLFDIRKLGRTTPLAELTARHRFHRLNETPLWWAIIVAGLIALVLVFFLPWSVVEFGLILGAVCAAYVGIVFSLPKRHPSLLLKEPLVAVLYAAGVWGSVWVQRPSITGTDITEGLMFTAIAFQNLLLFAVMEELEHAKQADFSLATHWGIATSNTILTVITVVVVGAALTLCFVVDDRFAQRSALIMGLMSLSLYGIQRFPNRFVKNERYRWLGDAVFWFPALVL
ncbi:UbiA prenyltransferase family protein [Spirosoma rhododendri]|uniref:Prenyltransferase n=1 Tax=Spirosoma rhododendri TaxID=2728024 RepID=A0A7L5DM51_9BACT|nr:hypothetical protein [Spirosoma rhododendri]QJD77147.1 hypothetical protein HH216_00975 [Spirosoma rhododendri]